MLLNLNKHAITKPKPKPTVNFKNCSYACVYHCVQLLYTTQHRKVLIIFPYCPPDNHHCSDAVYWKARDTDNDRCTTQFKADQETGLLSM